MFLDGRRMDADLTADVCIVGGGPAGITLALELADAGLNIVLLESGNEDSDVETQSLCEGENVGISYAPMEQMRSRFLGGSSNCWGGWCRPFDPIDFEERDWIPGSGWPFGLDEMQPFYERAYRYLRLRPDFSEAAWSDELRQKPLAEFPEKDSRVQNQIIQFSPPVRFGKEYRDELSRSGPIKVVLMANVTEIDNAGAGGRPIDVHVTTLADNRFTVKARSVVLSAGGIENARLMLMSRRSRSCGLGNENDLVGRFFMDHIRVRSSTISSSRLRSHLRQYDSRLMAFSQRLGRNPNKIAGHIAPTMESQRAMGLPNSRSYLLPHYAFEGSKSYQAMFEWRAYRARNKTFGDVENRTERELIGDIVTTMAAAPQGAVGVLDHVSNLPLPSRRFTIETVIETIPNPDSRVTLSGETDRLGVNKAVLNWQLTDRDRANIVSTTDLVEAEIVRNGVAKVDRHRGNQRLDFLTGCYHQMGTTKMHSDPKRGVVDRNAKIHDTHGIYCMGSSIFPTVGSDCPTLTLVALAIRLADWFKRDLNGILSQA